MLKVRKGDRCPHCTPRSVRLTDPTPAYGVMREQKYVLHGWVFLQCDRCGLRVDVSHQPEYAREAVRHE